MWHHLAVLWFLWDGYSYLIQLAPDPLWLTLLKDFLPSLVPAVMGKLNGFETFIQLFHKYHICYTNRAVSAVGMYWAIGTLEITPLTWLRCPQTPNHGLFQYCSSEPRPLPFQQSPSALPQSSWASFFVPLAQKWSRTSLCPECAPWSSTRSSRWSNDIHISWELTVISSYHDLHNFRNFFCIFFKHWQLSMPHS